MEKEDNKNGKKWSKRKKVLVTVGTVAGISVLIAAGYLIGKKLGYKEGLKDLNKLRDGSFRKGYAMGRSDEKKGTFRRLNEILNNEFEKGVNYVGSKSSYESKNIRDTGIKDGVKVGRWATLEGLCTPDLSNPDQLNLLVKYNTVLRKVSREEASSILENVNYDVERSNYYKHQIEHDQEY